MDFNSFETIDNDDDDVYGEENKADFCAEKNDNDFIDNSEVSNNACKYYRFENVTCSAEDALEDAFLQSSADLENSNDVSNFCDGSDEEVVEIDKFECSNEKARNLKGLSWARLSRFTFLFGMLCASLLKV